MKGLIHIYKYEEIFIWIVSAKKVTLPKKDKNQFKIILSLFEKTNKPILKVIEHQAERLAHFMGGKNLEIILQET